MLYGISTKTDGNMAFQHGEAETVVSNRKTFLSSLELSLEEAVASSNQHGDAIAVVDESMSGRGMSDIESAPQADALVTSSNGLVLFLLTADCIPLLLVDKAESVLALVHVSWKTATLGLPAKVLRLFSAQFSIPPNDVRAIFGPSIQKESYVLSPPLEQENDPQWKSFLFPLSSGKVAIDLVGFTAKQLKESGVPDSQVLFSPIDTAKSMDYFSHYRSVRTGEPEGRFATIAML